MRINGIDGVARVDGHGEVKLPGNFELFGKKENLTLPVECFHKTVKTDFADGGKPGIVPDEGEGSTELMHVGRHRGVVGRQKKRMNAECIVPTDQVGGVAGGYETGGEAGAEEPVRDAGGTGFLEEFRPVGIKVGGIKVRMGVNQFHGLRMLPILSVSTRSQRAASVASCVTMTAADPVRCAFSMRMSKTD